MNHVYYIGSHTGLLQDKGRTHPCPEGYFHGNILQGMDVSCLCLVGDLYVIQCNKHDSFPPMISVRFDLMCLQRKVFIVLSLL